MKRLVARTRLETPELGINSRNVSGQHKFYAEVQSRRYEKALSASGIRSVVYSVKRAGRKCTCIPSATVLDDKGMMSAEEVREIGRTVQGSWGDNKGVEYDAANLDMEIDRLDLDGSVSDGNTDLEEADFLGEGVHEDVLPDPFAGFGQTRCGVCFGTGYVGGYDVGKGTRIVLDAHANVENMRGLRTKTSSNPNEFFLFEDTGSLSFVRAFPPANRSDVSMFRLWNNDVPLEPDKFIWMNKKEFLDGSRNSLDVETHSSFTHAEIQFVNGLAFVDMGQPEERFDAVLTGQYSSASFNLPADVAANAQGIIRESKYNRAWQIVSVTTHRASGTTIFHEAEARLVAQHELFHLLPGPVA